MKQTFNLFHLLSECFYTVHRNNNSAKNRYLEPLLFSTHSLMRNEDKENTYMHSL